jgi:hypothetical protein
MVYPPEQTAHCVHQARAAHSTSHYVHQIYLLG